MIVVFEGSSIELDDVVAITEFQWHSGYYLQRNDWMDFTIIFRSREKLTFTFVGFKNYHRVEPNYNKLVYLYHRDKQVEVIS